MARGFSNALRIALGGVAGGLEGYGEKQERLGKASLLKQQQERQAEQDAINLAKSLVDMGFRPDFGEDDAIASSMPIPRQSTRLDTTLPTFGSGLAPAMERTRRESFGITPERPVAQPKPLVSALTQAEQVQPPRPRTGDKTLNVPGIGSMRMKRPETDEEKTDREIETYRRKLGVEQESQFLKLQEERKIKKEEYDETLQNLINAGVPKDMATKALSLGGKYNDLFMTPDQQADLALRRAQLKLDQDKFAFDKTKPVAGAKGAAGGTLDVPLPSIVDSVNYFSELTPDAIRKINPSGVMMANTGTQQGSWSELGLVGGGSALGMIGDQEKRYAQKAGSIADAVARASEVGVLTNFDINRFRSQVMLSPGDSEKLKQEKVARARSWGIWLANNKKAIDEGKLDRISKTPESVSGYQLSAPGSNPYR